MILEIIMIFIFLICFAYILFTIFFLRIDKQIRELIMQNLYPENVFTAVFHFDNGMTQKVLIQTDSVTNDHFRIDNKVYFVTKNALRTIKKSNILDRTPPEINYIHGYPHPLVFQSKDELMEKIKNENKKIPELYAADSSVIAQFEKVNFMQKMISAIKGDSFPFLYFILIGLAVGVAMLLLLRFGVIDVPMKVICKQG